MNDRELLELAARAAGVPGAWIENCPEDGCPTYSCGIGHRGRITALWNPLTDDGDALRLASKLRINLDYIDSTDTVSAQNGSHWYFEALDDYGVRRAIVQVAAEIGKAKGEA